MGFECLHCGRCCTNVAAQINLTLGDVQRLSEFTGKTIPQLIPKFLGIKPFGNPDSESYDLDLGLNMPCPFRKEGRCSVYAARPINCRIFPFWIISKASLDEMKDMLAYSPCIPKSSLSKDDRERCQRYTEALSEILLQEAEVTDALLDKEIGDRSISPDDFPGKLPVSVPDLQQSDAIKIRWLIGQLRRHRDFANLPEILQQELSDRATATQLITLSVLCQLDKKTKPF